MSQSLSEIFSVEGLLAQSMPSYRPRPAQLALAQAIQDAFQNHSVLVAEAGTGTGKTWAYLVPALCSSQKILISTGTRTLQDQLFSRDFPNLREALALPVTAALLKGRGNYVCHYYLDRVQNDDRALKSRTEVGYLREIQVFAQQSKTGDKAQLSSVPESADIWNRVSSTRENCLGQECPFVRDCFVLKARRKAQEADVVVINHALFMADLALRDEGITDLLPEVDAVVFDEAHQLPDIATRFLGLNISSHQLLDLSRLLEKAGLAHAREAADWSVLARQLEQPTRELRLSTAFIDRLPGRKATVDALLDNADFEKALQAIDDALRVIAGALRVVAEKHPDLTAAYNSTLELLNRLHRWRAVSPSLETTQKLGDIDTQNLDATSTEDVSVELLSSEASQASARDVLAKTPSVRWVENSTQAVRLHSAPLSVAKVFSGFRRPDQAWVFTSATLSVRGDFNYFKRQLGLNEALSQSWESPFDYASQAVLFVPEQMPLPSSPVFNQRFVEQLLPLIQETSGGVLVLCTTLRAVDQIADLLDEKLGSKSLNRRLLRQGEQSRGVLLDQFRAEKNAVLVGSASFWEGVDAPGDMLTLLAIDKLPFAPPDDPVLQARIDICRREKGNPFMEYQLPDAAIALKQGAGRLIRSETDWGVLMVGDVRLVEKPYGRILWQGLPPFARTRRLSDVIEFYKQRHAQPDSSIETI